MVNHKLSCTQKHKLGIINKTVTATKNTNNKGKKKTIKIVEVTDHELTFGTTTHTCSVYSM